MNALACDCSESVRGVGDWSGFLSGVGDFFSSGVGLELVKAGVSFGVGYGIHELTSGGGGGPRQQPALVGGTTVNPAGAIYNPLAQPAPTTAQAVSTPDWVMPAAIFGGLAVLALMLKK